MYVYMCARTILNRSTSFQVSSRNKLTSVVQYRHQSSTSANAENEIIRVYNGILTPQIRAVKILSISTSIAGIAAQPILLREVSNVGGIPVVVCVCGFVGFFTFVTPLLLHWVTKKYVTEIQFNSRTGQYTATLLSFFLRKKRITFTPDDVKVPDIGGMFSTFQVRGIHLFVEPRLFDDPLHYAKMMGYDKPLDLKLEGTCSEKENK